MSLNKEDLKKKIIYRSNYRGSKEMDLLMISFVESIIENLNLNDLIKLHDLVNLDDEKLHRIKNEPLKNNTTIENKIILKFKKFKH